MAIWSVGLATQRSAERASKWGGMAGLVQAARMTTGNIASVSVADKPLDSAIAWFIGASLIPVIFVLAGIRLWRGEGLIFGTLAVSIGVLDATLLCPPLTSAQTVIAVVVGGALLILMANGLRGALALQQVDYSSGAFRALD